MFPQTEREGATSKEGPNNSSSKGSMSDKKESEKSSTVIKGVSGAVSAREKGSTESTLVGESESEPSKMVPSLKKGEKMH